MTCKFICVLLMVFPFSFQKVFGQDNRLHSGYKIDTIQVLENKTLANVKEYQNGRLVSDARAFLYPDSIIKQNSFRVPLLNTLIRIPFSKVVIYGNKVVRDGQFKEYSEDGKSMVAFYENGKLTEFDFFNEEKVRITSVEYYGNVLKTGHRQPSYIIDRTPEFIISYCNGKPCNIKRKQ